MTPDNVQFNRDVMTSVEGRKAKRREPKRERSPFTDSSTSPGEKPSTSKKFIFDTSVVIKKIETIFDKHLPPLDWNVYTKMNSLQKMHFGYQIHRNKVNASELKYVNVLVFTDVMGFLMRRNVPIGYWLMYCDPFRELNVQDKMKLLEECCSPLIRLDTVSGLITSLGKKAYDEKLLMSAENTVFRLDDVRIDLSQITNSSTEDINRYFKPLLYRVIEELVKPLLAMEATEMETTYMLCQIFLSFAVKSAKPHIQEMAEKFQDEIANDIHTYFVVEKEMPNYAIRLHKLMNIVTIVQKLHSERLKMVELANLFDVFHVEFTESIRLSFEL